MILSFRGLPSPIPSRVQNIQCVSQGFMVFPTLLAIESPGHLDNLIIDDTSTKFAITLS